MVDSNFNCGACLKKFSLDYRDRVKGCNKDASSPVFKYQKSYEFTRCPGALKGGSVVELIRLHGLFESGGLPFDGGILEQPAKTMEAISLISMLKAEHQKDLEAKQKKWQTARSKSSSPSKTNRR